MRAQMEECLYPGIMNEWNKRLVWVWDVATSVANTAGTEVPVRSSIDELHCAVIAAKTVCSSFHIDDNNASLYACPVPDFHICLTDNPQISFAHVFVDNDNNEAIVVLALQSKGTRTNFIGAVTYHGSLCAPLLMDFLHHGGVPGEYHGTNEIEHNNLGAAWL